MKYAKCSRSNVNQAIFCLKIQFFKYISYIKTHYTNINLHKYARSVNNKFLSRAIDPIKNFHHDIPSFSRGNFLYLYYHYKNLKPFDEATWDTSNNRCTCRRIPVERHHSKRKKETADFAERKRRERDAKSARVRWSMIVALIGQTIDHLRPRVIRHCASIAATSLPVPEQ